MNDDGALLRHFAESNDQAAFRQLVERHIGFVYAVSRRRLRDDHAAHDATQAVFIALARKAAAVSRGPSLIGWLHRSAFFETRNLMRAHANRIARETEAQRLGLTGGEAEPAPVWSAIEAVLDEVLCELSDRDREAILARYFSGQSYAEIGVAFDVAENTARMRVDRALLKLRDRLQRRGITSTAAVLASGLPALASTVVPSGMAATVVTASLTVAGASAGAAGIFAFMSTTKILTSAAALALIGGLVYQYRQTAQVEATLAAVRAEHAVSTSHIRDLEKQIGALKDRPPVSPQPPASGLATPSSAAAEPPPTPGITKKAPKGWFKNGTDPKTYDVGVDETQPWGGMPSAYAKSITSNTEGFGGMMQTMSADAYHGQRVRLTGWIKTEDANDGGGHLWMRIDGAERGKTLQFDNMTGRAPKGTTDWQEYSVVLDVPPEASTVNYGFFVQGTGKMWVNGVTLTPVGAEVATTNLKLNPPTLPKTPVNLGFAPTPSP
jgi:RNA polymerase sigma factor (sigma-70 family)